MRDDAWNTLPVLPNNAMKEHSIPLYPKFSRSLVRSGIDLSHGQIGHVTVSLVREWELYVSMHG